MQRVFLNLSNSIKLPNRAVPVEFDRFTFSGGEEHIKIKKTDTIRNVNKVLLVSSMLNSSDVITTILATDAIRRINKNIKISLFAPYFPYARQDRVMVSGEPLSVKVLADIINSQAYNDVTVFDPHSDVTSALLNNVRVIPNTIFCSGVWNALSPIFGRHNMCLVSPDAGAEKKGLQIGKCFKY